MIDLSIIIVCHKGWDRLRKCLKALASFSGKGFTTEVIIVDNRSDDNEIGKIEKEFPGFRIIYNKVNGGFANGCNLGKRNASGEYLLFLNPDTVASESAIDKLLITAKRNPEYTIVSCKQVNENGKESIASGEFPSIFNLTGFQRVIFRWMTHDARRTTHDARRTTHDTRRTTHDARRTTHDTRRTTHDSRPATHDIDFPDWVSGSVILIRNDTFEKAGGFDEDFWMYFEDVDLCKRIRNTGGKIAFCRNIIVEHNHGGSSRVSLKTTTLTKTEVYISRHVYMSKHMTGFEKFLIQTFLIVNNIISGCIMALIGMALFFIPKIFSRTLIFFKLIRYYAGSLLRLSWISNMSVNFKKN